MTMTAVATDSLTKIKPEYDVPETEEVEEEDDDNDDDDDEEEDSDDEEEENGEDGHTLPASGYPTSYNTTNPITRRASKNNNNNSGTSRPDRILAVTDTSNLTPVRPKPVYPVDHDGQRVTQQKHIGLAWPNGPRIDLQHFVYVQDDFARRQEAVTRLRQRMALKSRPGYELRVQRQWTCTTITQMLLRRHFAWLPCVIATMSNAAWDGDILQIHSLILQHADVNSRDPHTGQLVLNISIQQQHEPITRFLLDRGADFNLQDSLTLRTPLITSIIMGNKALTRRLLTRGADVNLADSDGLTPLHWAALRGYMELVAQLLEMGANINQPDQEGWTALHIVCFKGYADLVEYLLVNGHATLETEDIYGFTPFMYARIAENHDIMKILDEYVETLAQGKKNKNRWSKSSRKKKKNPMTPVDLAKVSPKKLFVTSKN